MKNIVIIGAGQLGSRHLQGLALSNHPLNIQVVDPSAESLKIAESRFKEVAGTFTGKVAFLSTLEKLEKKIDVAIIATSSKVRKDVIFSLFESATVNYLILEKVLFIKESDYIDVALLFQKTDTKVWVNCARRLYKVYTDLKSELQGPLNMTVVGNEWGLGCNGIHFIDLFAYLTGETGLQLSTASLVDEIFESKRNGYVEFYGTINGEVKGNNLSLTSFSGTPSPMRINIDTPKARYSIQEGGKGKIWISRAENNWSWEESNIEMPFQSQLTNLLVDELLEKGTCDLTTFEESSSLHLTFLKSLLSFIRVLKNDNSITECPIT